MSGPAPIDVGDLLDFGPWTRFQKIAVLLCALAIVLDGLDGQLIGYAIPVMMKQWRVGRGAFAPVVAAGLIGMGFGSFFAGVIGDWAGRRRAILFSVLGFGVATCAIGLVNDIPGLIGLRFLAGLGIGGCLPSATTMAAEYTPARSRTMAVTATIVCVPLGGILAGGLANGLLQQVGWRGLFFLGGVLPIAVSGLLTWALPESPRYLVNRPSKWPALAKLMGRLSRPVAFDATFVDQREQQLNLKGGLRSLFGARGMETTLIGSAFFLCLFSVYSAFSWLPALLTSEGLKVGFAARGLAAYNLGGVVGALACAVAIARFGSRWPLVLCGLGGAASAIALEHVSAGSPGLMLGLLTLHGLFVNAVQSTLYALCAYVYPTLIRATGTAFAVTVGRIGAILSAFTGAQLITGGGAGAYFTMLCLAMFLTSVALVLLRSHIPRPAASR